MCGLVRWGRVTGDPTMELRQLRFFLTLAEELHFGRAAAREHIVQSALSQQIRRLEHQIGVQLVERNTHHVRLTAAGEALVTEARVVLSAVERAVAAAREVNAHAAVLRVAVGDASLDSMPQILRNVQYNAPELVVHRLESTVPQQYRMLAEHTLDVGFGRASRAPAGIASEVFRLDPLGILVRASSDLPSGDGVALSALETLPVLFAQDEEAPEFNEFVTAMCHAVGFEPIRFHGSVQSARAAAFLVAEQRCVAVVPRSCDVMVPGVVWRPLTPTHRYPWSIMWRADEERWPLAAVRRSARMLAQKFGWLADGAADGPAGAPSA